MVVRSHGLPGTIMATRLRRLRRRILIRRTVALAALIAVAAAVILIVRGGSADRHGATVTRFTIRSRFVHRTLPAVLVIPPGGSGRGRPLLVFLHGKGSDGQDANLTSAMFAALASEGARAPDVVFPNGGDDSYWHNRAGGAWASYVVHAVIPRALALSGADPRRVAIGGISMGGFGALYIALAKPGRFCAIGAHSAALWFRGADSAAGAFDDAADFARHDVVRAARRGNPYGRTPVWIDVGTGDPFLRTDTALAHALRADHADIAFSTGPGGHDSDYWNSRWSDYMKFYATRLQGCRT
jgi:S-formylglutathione hydrolase FrmB